MRLNPILIIKSIFIFLIINHCLAQKTLKQVYQIPLQGTKYYTFVHQTGHKAYLVIDNGLGLKCYKLGDASAKLIWLKAGFKLRFTQETYQPFIIANDFMLGHKQIHFYSIEIESGKIIDQLTVNIKSNQRLDTYHYVHPYYLAELFSENQTEEVARKHYLLFKINDGKIILSDRFDFDITIIDFMIKNDILIGSNAAGCNRMNPVYGLPDCSPCLFSFSLVSHRLLNRFAITEGQYSGCEFTLKDSIVYYIYSSNSYADLQFSGLALLSFPDFRLIKKRSLPFTFNVNKKFLLNQDSLILFILDEKNKKLYFYDQNLNEIKHLALPVQKEPIPVSLSPHMFINQQYYLLLANIDSDKNLEFVIYHRKNILPKDPRAIIIPDSYGRVIQTSNIYYVDDDLQDVRILAKSLKFRGDQSSFFQMYNKLLLITNYSLTWYELQ